MVPPENEGPTDPGDGPVHTGFDRARLPSSKSVSMRAPEMEDRRERTRQNRARRRARQRRARLIFIGSVTVVLLVLIGMTIYNVMTRGVPAEAAPADPLESGAVADGEEEGGVADGAAPAEAKPAVPEVATGPGPAKKGNSLDEARQRYLLRERVEGSGTADAASAGKGLLPDREGEAIAEGGVDPAEKERLLRQAMPFYRNRREQTQTPATGAELYFVNPETGEPIRRLPDPIKKKK